TNYNTRNTMKNNNKIRSRHAFVTTEKAKCMVTPKAALMALGISDWYFSNLISRPRSANYSDVRSRWMIRL
ncbi:hypothetical protein J6590_104334, partial [Homalodisca vitripennis]